MTDQKVSKEDFFGFLSDKITGIERIRFSTPERANYYCLSEDCWEFVGYWYSSYENDLEEYWVKPIPFEKYACHSGGRIGRKI